MYTARHFEGQTIPFQIIQSLITETTMRVLVAGDVCLDVLGVQIPKKSSQDDAENWRQTGEMRTHFLPGGAMLLAEFVRAPILLERMKGEEEKVRKIVERKEKDKGKTENEVAKQLKLKEIAIRREIENTIAGPRPLSPDSIKGSKKELLTCEFLDLAERLRRDEIVHSLLQGEAFPKTTKPDDENKVYRVEQEFGFSGPTGDDPPKLRISYPISEDAPRIIVISDTGNRFRKGPEDSNVTWPEALTAPKNPDKTLVFYKLHRPLPSQDGDNVLWESTKDKFKSNRIVIVSCDDLRAAGAPISEELSWERTALDVVWHLLNVSAFTELRACPRLIVRLGLDGAILWQCSESEDGQPRYHAWLVYDPNGIEGCFERSVPGQMVGSGLRWPRLDGRVIP